MPQDFAYRQLLTLIAARGQQWVRNRLDAMPVPVAGHHVRDLADIAVAARVCSDLRGIDAPLLEFTRGRLSEDFFQCLAQRMQTGLTDRSPSETFLLAGRQDIPALSMDRPLADRLASSAQPEPALLSEVETYLRKPIPQDNLTDGIVEDYAWVLGLSYRLGAQRPKFGASRTYGDAFANCLRFTDWAQRKGRLLPLVQGIFCLRLIDPDHDVLPMLGDVISSQRPDGSFPSRIGFGTTDQGEAALRPTLATVTALHLAIYRGMHGPQPAPVPMAA